MLGESRDQVTEINQVTPGSGETQCCEKPVLDHEKQERRRSGVQMLGRREETLEVT